MMRMLQDSTNLGKTHARTPVVILLPNDLKRLVQYVRDVVIERQHRPAASESQLEDGHSEDMDSQSS
jgi:hypothetical protein